MAFQVQLNCPHCLTTNSGFTGLSYALLRPGGPDYIVLLQCGVCGNGVIGKYAGGPNFPTWFSNQLGQKPALIETWPERRVTEVPQHLPDNVASYYRQGMGSLDQKHYDAAGTMFRKALDTGLKKLNPQGKG